MSEESAEPGRPGRRRRRRGRGRGGRSGQGVPPQAAASAPQAPPSRAPRQRGQRGQRARRESASQPRVERELEITDEKIFARLLDTGLDLGEEAFLEAFLYFTGENPARRVAAQLEEGGYQTYVDPSPPGRWLLEAVTRGVPTPERMAEMGSQLRTLARASGGIYDGWWASEIPEDGEEETPTEPPELGS